MWDFDIGEAMAAMAKTAPFLILRLVVYLGIALGYVVATGVGAGLGAAVGLLGGIAGGGAMWGGIIGFGVISAVLYWAREYLLYLVKAGHIAVLVELYDGNDLPAGKGQIDYAQGIVRERFVEASMLFGLDRLIRLVVRAINRLLFTVANFIPIPFLRGLASLATKVINLSLVYTDELILAYNMRTRSTNPWASSKDALILYAQNYRQILKNALFLLFIMWGITLVVFAVFLAPAAALAVVLPGQVGVIGVLIALVFAYAVKAAVLEPFAVAAMMQVYFKAIEGQVPDAEWDERLSKASGKFRQIKDQAAGWTGPGNSAPAGAS